MSESESGSLTTIRAKLCPREGKEQSYELQKLSWSEFPRENQSIYTQGRGLQPAVAQVQRNKGLLVIRRLDVSGTWPWKLANCILRCLESRSSRRKWF